MKTERTDSELPECVSQRWWWRRLVFLEFDELTHTTKWRRLVREYPSYGFSAEWNSWHRREELIAFRLELLRRTDFSQLPEWHSVPVWQAAWIRGVIAPKPERAVCGIFPPSLSAGYASLGRLMWDLTASDESLCRLFISCINEERRRRGLPDTDDPFTRITVPANKHTEKRRGKRNRQVSWLAVEAHDIRSFGIRPLTAGERSRVSKARRELAAFVEPLRRALENAEHLTPKADKAASSGESLYARFLRENFVRRLASRTPDK